MGLGGSKSNGRGAADLEYHGVPGVVYSEFWKPPSLEEIPMFDGSLRHLIRERIPQGLQDQMKDMQSKPAPEDVPYTFWEHTGLMPVNVTRLRPRQFYYPVTDFRKYSYDQASPEERRLKAHWLARLYDVNWQLPIGIWSIGCCFSVALPSTMRLPLLTCTAVTAVLCEGTRCYVGAMRERERLDDYIVAKEIWYMKNVETKELQLNTIDPAVKPELWYGQEEQKIYKEELEKVRDALYQMPPTKESDGFVTSSVASRRSIDSSSVSAPAGSATPSTLAPHLHPTSQMAAQMDPPPRVGTR